MLPPHLMDHPDVYVCVTRINSPYATNGPHSVSAATTKGDLALVFIAAASDKQVGVVLHHSGDVC
jgi:hypothetical protein